MIYYYYHIHNTTQILEPRRPYSQQKSTSYQMCIKHRISNTYRNILSPYERQSQFHDNTQQGHLV